jgi:DNA primase catalytic core
VASHVSDGAVEQIKARLNVVEIVQQHVPLRRRGRDWWGLCPFHQEKTPSFKVSEQQQSWYCFGCQRGGDLFSFIQEIEKIDFRAALDLLADLAGVSLPDQMPADRHRRARKKRILELNALAARYYAYVLFSTPAGEPGRSLLTDREVSEDTARHFGLGYAPAGGNFATFLRKRGYPVAEAEAAGLLRRDGSDYFQQRLMIPIRDERGRPVAFTARTVLLDEVRKYLNTPETPAYIKSRVLFGLDVARSGIEKQGMAVLMEGQFDVMVAHQHGVSNVVASSGTALTPEQVMVLKRFTDELLLVFDNDRAGRTAASKAVDLVEGQQMRARIGRIPGSSKDPDEFLRAGGDWQALLREARPAREQLIRDCLEHLNPARPDHLELAKRDVQAELDRINDPALWARYDELAKNLLELDPRISIFRRPNMKKVSRSPSPQPSLAMGKGAGGLGPQLEGNNISKSVGYLLQVLVLCPEAVTRVRKIIDPVSELDEDDRTAYLRIVDVLERGGSDGLKRELDGFPLVEQQLIRHAWAAPPLGDLAVVAEDVARQVQRQASTRQRRAIINGLREAERRGDMQTVSDLEKKLRHVAASQ